MAEDREKVLDESGPATDADIAEFRQFRRDMEGESYQDGSRFDTSDRGFGSGTHKPTPHRMTEPEPNVSDRHAEKDYVEEEAPPAEDPSRWKKLYGESENAKGEWRRMAQEQNEELARLRTELEVLREARNSYQTASTSGSGAPAPTAPQIPETFFPEKSPGDLVDVNDMDKMLATVANVVWQQNQALQNLQSQSAASAKLVAGITPALETKMLSTNSWLRSVPDGPARVEAMKSMLAREREDDKPSDPRPRPRTTMVSPSQAAARRATYIESGKAPSASPDEGVPVMEQVARELAEARAKGGARAMRSVLNKHGMDSVNDWGPDVWGPAR